MSNPFFTNDPFFGDSRKAQTQRRDAAQQPVPQAGTGLYPASTATTLSPSPSVDSLESAYRMPAASSYETGRMTYDDVIIRTATLLAVVVTVGAATWFGPMAIGSPELIVPLMMVGLVGGLVLGLVNAFKKEPSPALILAYAAFQGAFLGGISGIYESQWDGVVVQAVLATVATFAATLMLFKSGKVRVTPKFQRIVLVALVGYALFSLLNIVLVWTGVLGGWGLRSGGFGILIGVAAVILAAATLVIDFDSITKGIQRGAPATYAWAAAFGLVVTLIWMYLEFLRLLAILRGD